jgi:hypothetical protein
VRIAHSVIMGGDRTLQRSRPLKVLRFRLSLGQLLPVSTRAYSALMPKWETMAVLETKRAFALLLTPTSVPSGEWDENSLVGLTSTLGNCTTDIQCDPQMSVDLFHPCNKDPMAIYGNFNLADHPCLPLIRRFSKSSLSS